ncbi:MAG: Flp pilus assembly complex ATPase component TadA [Gemmatimonadales bacterium]|nr:Flp pilus assembly complex ATPase component TadA [Gemmatimonadales bacterium]
MSATKTKKLGQILVDSGNITQEQLEKALKEQKQTREKLGVILQRLGITTETEIARVLANQAGVEFITLGKRRIEKEILELLPPEFSENNRILPIGLKGNTIILAMANPLDLDIIDKVQQMTGSYIEVVHASDSDIGATLSTNFGSVEDTDKSLLECIEQAGEAIGRGDSGIDKGSPLIKLVDHLIKKGIDDHATDIHIEPEEKVLRSRFRVDGHLIEGPYMPMGLHASIVTRFKILAGMNISESRQPQDGRIMHQIGPRTVDLRVSTFPSVNGETVVCRLLDKQNLVLGLERMGMDAELKRRFTRDISKPHGILLVTGPTGSGKTTTLYSALSHINTPDVKIITLEDPVEYEIPMVSQAQINVKQGFTFASGLRSILRQDPDIILVGEIRDQETAELAIRAALTGHLVFSTLHTNSAAGAIPRLTEMGIEPFLLSATLVGLLGQRLIRRICPDCRTTQPPTSDQIEALDLASLGEGPSEFSVGQGCSNCHNSGYRGRLAVFEYLPVDQDIRELINHKADAGRIESTAVEKGMQTLGRDTLKHVLAGETSLAELGRVGL